jgi:prefoldin alpha subunit
MQDQKDLQLQIQNLNLLQQQLEILQGQLQIVDSSLQLVKSAKDTIEGFTGIKVGDEIIVPIGGMAFIKVNIIDPEKIMIYLGANVVVEKNVKESLEYLDSLIERHNKQREALVTQYERMSAQVRVLTPVVQEKLNQMQNIPGSQS